MNSVFSSKVKITSNLSVDFYPFPKVVQRWSTVRFVVTSKAKSFEWDFEMELKTTTNPVMQYNYKNSLTYTVLLTVRDIDGNSNKMSKTVYVWDSNNPVAVIWLTQWDASTPKFW